MDHHVTHSAAGALGGLLGTAFIMQSMKLTSKLPEAIKPPTPSKDPAEFLVEQGERAVLHRPLSKRQHTAVAHGLHWAYGVGWAAALGAIAPELRVHKPSTALAAGATLGAIVWGAGYLGWLPAAHLVAPPTKQRPAPMLVGLVSHVMYGALAALPLLALGRFLQAKSPRARAFGVLHGLTQFLR